MSSGDIPHITIVGGIGFGKTETVKSLAEKIKKEDGLNVYPSLERVWKWKKSGILKAFYENMKLNAYKFQQYLLADRLAQFAQIPKGTHLIISDGWWETDSECFTRKLVEDNLISKEEREWYLDIFADYKIVAPMRNPIKIIRLKLNAEKAIERIKKRDRMEEVGIQVGYLNSLEDHMDKMLKKSEWKNLVLEINSEELEEKVVEMIYQKLRTVIDEVKENKIKQELKKKKRKSIPNENIFSDAQWIPISIGLLTLAFILGYLLKLN